MLVILHLYPPPWRILRAKRVEWWDLPAVACRSIALRVDWQLELRLAWALSREFMFAATGFFDCPRLAQTPYYAVR